MSDPRTPPEIFYSYSHRDEALRKQLVTHLASLKRRGRISEWHDRMIEAGTDWEQEISTHLESAQIILLLVSATFIESEYCFSIEMTRAMERHQDGEARVIPIILRDVVWTGLPFSGLQALPSGGRPVESWGRRNSAFTDIVRGIDTVIDSLAAVTEKEEAPPEMRASGVVTNVIGHHGYFTGRDTILGQVHAGLAKGKGRERVQVLHGLSGVGKSRLAIEYMHRYGHEYRLAWRLRATEPTRIADDFAEMAGPLGLPVADPTDLPAIRDAVNRWLANHDNWLLVFDDASKPEDIIPYLPTEVRGHVLVTSLNPAWRRIGTPRRVYHLNRDASITFLLDQTGLDDREGAGKVADLLGGLPLALSQAAAYIETRTDFAGYVRLFERRRKALWQQEEAPEDHGRRSVEVSFTLAISQVEKAQRAAADLLRLCAFYAPDDIPIWLIRDGAVHLPRALRALVEDEIVWNETVALLTRYSLVDVGATGISVHNLVQVVVRDSLSEAGQRRWARTAVKLMLAAFPQESGDVRTWDRCAPLLSHALAAVDDAEALQINLAEVSWILDRAATYLKGRGQYADARTHFERALRIDEATHSPDDPIVATGFTNLGGALRDLGDLSGARTYFERALQINEAVYGSDHATIAINANNLGAVLRDLGRPAEARVYSERALRIDESVYGPDHIEVAYDANTLGAALQALGEFAEARAYYARARRIVETTYGFDHPLLAACINNLGSLLYEEGDLVGAQVHAELALRIDETAYGSEHPQVAIRLHNVGRVLQALRNLDEARKYLSRALGIFEKVYGADHSHTKLCRENLEALEGGAGPGD